MLTLNYAKHYTLSVYLSPVCGCVKPTLWLENYDKLIKLASFVDKERAQLFIDYCEEKGILVDTYDFDEGDKQ